jgi:hypothetical protein
MHGCRSVSCSDVICPSRFSSSSPASGGRSTARLIAQPKARRSLKNGFYSEQIGRGALLIPDGHDSNLPPLRGSFGSRMNMWVDALSRWHGQLTILMNMPPGYAQAAFTMSMPVAGLLLLIWQWPALREQGVSFESVCRLMPGMLFAGGALTAIGYVVCRMVEAAQRCSIGAAFIASNTEAACRWFPLFPGNGGLVIHLVMNAGLLWWWRRSVYRESSRITCRLHCKSTSQRERARPRVR